MRRIRRGWVIRNMDFSPCGWVHKVNSMLRQKEQLLGIMDSKALFCSDWEGNVRTIPAMVLFLCLFFAAPPGPAVERKSGKDKPVTDYIKDLGDPNPRVREKAADGLGIIGKSSNRGSREGSQN